MKRAIEMARQKARGARGAAFVLAAGSCTMLLASCVAGPQTIDEAANRSFSFGRSGEVEYPKCSAAARDLHGVSFQKPAVDVGNGRVATISEAMAFGSSGRSAEVVDCETGLSLYFSEPYVDADAGTGEVQTFSKDRAFKSPLEKFLHGLAASGQSSSLRSISSFARSEGLSAQPWISWNPNVFGDSAFAKTDVCACDLYYPGTARYWFDNERVGPGYPEALGSNPRTLTELEARMSALRALK